MKFKYLILPLLVTLFMVQPACIKKKLAEDKKCDIGDQLCDSALLVLQNKTMDTINFNRGGSGMGFKWVIKPAETMTFTTASVEVRFNGDCSAYKSMTNVQEIGTPLMYYSIEMNRCTKHAYFVKNNNRINLEVEK